MFDNEDFGIRSHAAVPTIKNNWVYRNGNTGIKFEGQTGSVGTVRNNTVAYNSAKGVWSHGYATDPVVSNCILWGNDNDIAGCTATYSCIQDDDPGLGNITGDANDPNFVDADANDFHIEPDSPCIDTGHPNEPNSTTDETDIDGHPRVMLEGVDMGADEAGYPIGHWKMDEGSGTIAYDYVGDNDGTVYGATWTTGQIDGALSFDGNEDYVEVPSSVSFDSTTATWSLWVKPTGDPGGSGSSPWGTGCIMIRGDSWGTWNGVHISLMPHATYGTITIQVKANANPSVLVEDTVFSSPDISYNDWSHIAFVFDSGNYAELYVNGALTVNYTLGNFAFNNQVLRIATSTDPYLYDFNGEVDEVVIHDRGLSSEEIQELYQDGL